jgi:flagellar hook-length control protein FliK
MTPTDILALAGNARTPGGSASSPTPSGREGKQAPDFEIEMEGGDRAPGGNAAEISPREGRASLPAAAAAASAAAAGPPEAPQGASDAPPPATPGAAPAAREVSPAPDPARAGGIASMPAGEAPRTPPAKDRSAPPERTAQSHAPEEDAVAPPVEAAAPVARPEPASQGGGQPGGAAAGPGPAPVEGVAPKPREEAAWGVNPAPRPTFDAPAREARTATLADAAPPAEGPSRRDIPAGAPPAGTPLVEEPPVAAAEGGDGSPDVVPPGRVAAGAATIAASQPAAAGRRTVAEVEPRQSGSDGAPVKAEAPAASLRNAAATPAPGPAAAAPVELMAAAAEPARAWHLSAQPAEHVAGPSAHATVRPAVVAEQIASAIGVSRDGQVELRLDPPELGRVQIQLIAGEDGTRAVITVERPETHDLLRRHAELLSRDLAEAGFGPMSLELSLGHEAPDRGEDAAPEPEPPAVHLQLEPGTAARLPASRPGSGGLDIRL